MLPVICNITDQNAKPTKYEIDPTLAPNTGMVYQTSVWTASGGQYSPADVHSSNASRTARNEENDKLYPDKSVCEPYVQSVYDCLSCINPQKCGYDGNVNDCKNHTDDNCLLPNNAECSRRKSSKLTNEGECGGSWNNCRVQRFNTTGNLQNAYDGPAACPGVSPGTNSPTLAAPKQIKWSGTNEYSVAFWNETRHTRNWHSKKNAEASTYNLVTSNIFPPWEYHKDNGITRFTYYQKLGMLHAHKNGCDDAAYDDITPSPSPTPQQLEQVDGFALYCAAHPTYMPTISASKAANLGMGWPEWVDQTTSHPEIDSAAFMSRCSNMYFDVDGSLGDDGTAVLGQAVTVTLGQGDGSFTHSLGDTSPLLEKNGGVYCQPGAVVSTDKPITYSAITRGLNMNGDFVGWNNYGERYLPNTTQYTWSHSATNDNDNVSYLYLQPATSISTTESTETSTMSTPTTPPPADLLKLTCGAGPNAGYEWSQIIESDNRVESDNSAWVCQKKVPEWYKRSPGSFFKTTLDDVTCPPGYDKTQLWMKDSDGKADSAVLPSRYDMCQPKEQSCPYTKIISGTCEHLTSAPAGCAAYYSAGTGAANTPAACMRNHAPTSGPLCITQPNSCTADSHLPLWTITS